MAAAPRLSAFLDEHLGASRYRTCGVDLNGVAFLDSTGIRASGGTDATS